MKSPHSLNVVSNYMGFGFGLIPPHTVPGDKLRLGGGQGRRPLDIRYELLHE